jgi:hypothetical protein
LFEIFGSVVSTTLEPIRNPVTGEAHRAISNRNSYARFAAVDWSNA